MKYFHPICKIYILFFCFIALILFGIEKSGSFSKLNSDQILEDAGFEESTPNGTFPSSGKWKTAWLGEAGACCTTTSAHTGQCGLWQYTGTSSTDWWSGPYQEFDGLEGQLYKASAYIRTPSGAEWVTGASAKVRLEFRDSSSAVIAYYESAGIDQPNTDWRLESTDIHTAPTGTAKVRFICYLSKPLTISGVAVANFDDCSLDKTTMVPCISINPPVLGFGNRFSSLSFEIRNIGSGTLTWSLVGNPSWVTVSDNSGDIEDTPKVINVTVNRDLMPDFCTFCTLNINSNGGNGTIEVHAEQSPQLSVPKQPSIVRIDGRRLMIQKRNIDGFLLPEKPYIIKGVCWSPASIGTLPDRLSRQKEFAKMYDLDIQLLHEMCGNTVYTFLDQDDDSTAIQILDYLYVNDIISIVTVDWDGTNDVDRINQIVLYYKNHPAILMWAIGNEWNINLFHSKYNNLDSAAQANESAAQLIKTIDSNHPVASIYGEIEILPDQPLTKTKQIVNETCQSVDVWGLNIYRGDNFSNLFDQWASITSKPMFIAEFGTDSYQTTGYWPVVGSPNEIMQKNFILSLLEDIRPELSAINPMKVCLGGALFEWVDEWWKVKDSDGGSPSTHDNGGFPTWWNPNAHPDGFGNEEYFGIFNIDRTEKLSRQILKDFFMSLYNSYWILY